MKLNRIVKYHSVCSQRGENFFVASLRFPERYWLLHSGSVERGYGLYHLPLLASFSRSGTNWVRYIIEWSTGKPTPGAPRLIRGYDFVCDRAHKAYPIMENYGKVLFVLRDYRECLLRHHWKAYETSESIEHFLLRDDLKQPCAWYWKNLQAFDEFKGDKNILYYEDLIAPDHNIIASILTFFGEDANRSGPFIRDLAEHKNISIGFYDAKHGSQTKGEKTARHADRILSEERKSFDRFFETNHPVLFEKYLSRYQI